ncbi:MAG: rhomboid family intramembrane serine protease [Deltaproteobacteria bacterium]|nr:rhomboid family intramembrane serine protease [Deltaproteobacteria bacterium]
MTAQDLLFPLLFSTALAVTIFAFRLWKSAPIRQTLDWWIALGCISVPSVALAVVPSTRGYAGLVSFSLLTLLLFAPLRLHAWFLRAVRVGQPRMARLWLTLFAVLHPSQATRHLRATLPSLLRLRQGADIDDATLDTLANGSPSARNTLDVVRLHNLGKIQQVYHAFVPLKEREELLRQGLGMVYLQSVALIDMSPDALATAVAEVLAMDPTMSTKNADRRALLVAYVLAYAGDLDGATTASRELRAYLAPGVPVAVRAVAAFVTGDAQSAAKWLTEERARLGDTTLSAAALRGLERTLEAVPPRTRAQSSPALESLVVRLRTEQRELAATAPLEGRASIAWLTTAQCALLLAVHAWVTLRGNSLDPEHLFVSGGLVGGSLDPWSEPWRLLTHGLLHAGALHLIFNVVALWHFGRFCEAFYGRIALVLIYVSATVASGLTVMHFADPLRPMLLVGASGAIFALIGALGVVLLFKGELRRARSGRSMLVGVGITFAAQAVIDTFTPGISQTAHLSGFAFGALSGLVILSVRALVKARTSGAERAGIP